MARDGNLMLSGNLPVSGQSNVVGALDLGVTAIPLSDQWRQGRLSVDVPAIPNATNPNAAITLTLQDTQDGVNFANCQPLCQVVLPGQAGGILACGPGQFASPLSVDFPLPPRLRGPIQILQSVPANIGGDCSQQTISYWWECE